MTPNEFFLYGISRIDLVAHSNASGEVARSSAAMSDGEGADPVDEGFAGWIAETERERERGDTSLSSSPFQKLGTSSTIGGRL